jgi:hypothetical protein
MQKTEDCAKIDSILQKVCQEVPYLYFITWTTCDILC